MPSGRAAEDQEVARLKSSPQQVDRVEREASSDGRLDRQEALVSGSGNFMEAFLVHVRNAFIAAAQDGRLHSALAEVRNSKDFTTAQDEPRSPGPLAGVSTMKPSMIAHSPARLASERKLQNLRQWVQAGENSRVSDSQDILKSKLQETLSKAAANGSLQAALSEFTVIEQSREAVDPSIEDIQSKMRDMPEESVEDIRSKMRDMLEECCKSGAASEAPAVVEECELDLSDIRSKMRFALEEACANGSFQDAFTELQEDNGAFRIEDDMSELCGIESLRERLYEKMMNAHDSGQLAETLCKLGDEQELMDEFGNVVEQGNIEDLRQKLHGKMLEACESGTLQDMMSSLAKSADVDEPPDVPLEEDYKLCTEDLGDTSLGEANAKLKTAFIDASGTGRLQEIMNSLVTEATEEAKQKLQRSFVAGSRDGRLQSALLELAAGCDTEAPPIQEGSAVKQDSGPQDSTLHQMTSDFEEIPDDFDLEEIRLHMKEMLEEACDNGLLTEALGTLQDDEHIVDGDLQDTRDGALKQESSKGSVADAGTQNTQEEAASQETPEMLARELPEETAEILDAAQTSRELPIEPAATEVAETTELLDAAQTSREFPIETGATEGAPSPKSVESVTAKEKINAEALEKKAEAGMQAQEASKPLAPVKPAAAKPKYLRNPKAARAKSAKGVYDNESMVVRVANLLAQIKEAREQIEQRDKLAEKLEGQLSVVRGQCVDLERDLDSHKRALQNADTQGKALEAALLSEGEKRQQVAA